jgi:hypothetical protein
VREVEQVEEIVRVAVALRAVLMAGQERPLDEGEDRRVISGFVRDIVTLGGEDPYPVRVLPGFSFKDWGGLGRTMSGSRALPLPPLPNCRSPAAAIATIRYRVRCRAA